MSAGTCEYCQCTDAAACEGGCSWVDEARELCSQCDFRERVARLFVDVQAAVLEGERVARDEAASWEARSLEQRTALVMSAGAVITALRQEVMDAVGGEEADAGGHALAELARLATALHDRYPDKVQGALLGDGSIVDVALELLGTKRIVLAGGL
jgi:hypothetical protein